MILRVENVTKSYPTGGRKFLRARNSTFVLKDVSLSIAKGESFGLIGESGSGKSTLARCLLRLENVDSGRIWLDGTDLTTVSAAEMRRIRARLQIVFQDPYSSLNPRMTVHDIVAEPLVIHRRSIRLGARQRTARVVELLDLVGLGTQQLFRFPHEFSGGQRQRIGIARALAVNPDFLILDEPTSALDVQVQAQVLNLLKELRTMLGLTYLFISHDLGVIRYVCNKVALISKGEIVEMGDVDSVFDDPQSSYARMLLEAIPDPDPERSPFHVRTVNHK